MRCYQGAECTHHIGTGRLRLLARCKDRPLTCCTLLACPFCRGDAYFYTQGGKISDLLAHGKIQCYDHACMCF